MFRLCSIVLCGLIGSDLFASGAQPESAVPVDEIQQARQSLANLEHRFGPDDLMVATALDRLGWLYLQQSRVADAEPVVRRALAIREGRHSAEVVRSLNNLAFVLHAEGHYAEAEALFQRALPLDEKEAGPDAPATATCLSNLAALYVDEGRLREAEPLFTRALHIRQKRGDAALGTALNNLGQLYADEGRYGEAEAMLKTAVELGEAKKGDAKPGDTTQAARSTEPSTELNNLAVLYNEEGRYREAEALQQRALDIETRVLGPESPSLATGLSNIAQDYVQEGRLAEAEQALKRAGALLQKSLGPNHPRSATVLGNLGSLYEIEARYGEAEALFQQALAIDERTLPPDHPAIGNILNNLAFNATNERHYADAEALYRQALSIEERSFGSDHPRVANTLDNMAVLYKAEGSFRQALAYARRATAIYAARRFAASAPTEPSSNGVPSGLQAQWLIHIDAAHAVLQADPSQGAGLTAETFEVAQYASESATSLALAEASARFSTGTDRLGTTIRAREDAVQRWNAVDKALTGALSKPVELRNLPAEAGLRQQRDRLEATIKSLDDLLVSQFPAFAELSNPRPVPLAEAQRLLAPDEALLVYMTAPEETYLWAVRRDGAALMKLPIGGAELTRRVSALRATLDPERNPEMRPFEVDQSYSLYQRLVAPAAQSLKGARAIFVVSDGALQSLPLSVLVTRPTPPIRGPLDYRRISWLARQYAPILLPAVSSLRALREVARRSTADLSFIGIGDPVLAGSEPRLRRRGISAASFFRGTAADVDQLRNLPSLPETADELHALAASLGAGSDSLYLADRATKPVVETLPLGRYRVVAFATHGLVAGDFNNLTQPALVLTPPAKATDADDGLLKAADVAQLKLNADWVILSACNTAAGESPGAPGLSGLAKAFFYAGTRTLLVSNWSVASNAAVKLTTGTLAALKRDPGIGRAEALRRAEMAMIDDPALPPQFAHPMIWAPFSLVGEDGVRH